MNIKKQLFSVFLLALTFSAFSQTHSEARDLAAIRHEGLQNSKAYETLSELTDVYGQRLTGSREYLAAAQWMSEKMKNVGLQKVHFENYCENCRGWSVNSYNVEMIAPNYMHIIAYPMAMAKSSNGIVEAEIVHIKSMRNMDAIKKEFTGKLNGKIVLLGSEPKMDGLTDTVLKRYSEKELEKLEDRLIPKTNQTPLPELIKSWETSDKYDQPFLEFVEKEGGIAVLRSYGGLPGVVHIGGTYYYLENDFKPLPYFAIAPEHFGRMVRALQQGAAPKIKLNLDTEFYMEPENNVNVIGELTGTDAKFKSEILLIGGHFDSWHTATGATDNAASAVVLLEALRILKTTGLLPKRTVRIGLWGGEEQAFLGSVAYAKEHYGAMNKQPNAASKKVTAYLNLDNGAGAIRGIYLQSNEFAKPTFKEAFIALNGLSEGTLTIENTLSTDHETFDHYNIPAFQFIQDGLSYGSITHHTNLDFIEYVPKEDLMKNAVILAWTIHKLANNKEMVPRKKK